MCEQVWGFEKPSPAQLSNKRLKLWDLNPHLHCAVLGTCLTMPELRKALRQGGVTIPPDAIDYALHNTAVGHAKERNRLSKTLNKSLERKFLRWIQCFSSLNDSNELEHHWQRAIQCGDVGGPFWALVTHPLCSTELMNLAYSDIHMLSHLQGASNRADLKRLQALETEVRELQVKLLEQRQHHARQLLRRDELLREQERDLRAQSLQFNALRHPPEQPAVDLHEQRKHSATLQRLEWTEQKLSERDMQNASLGEELAGLRELLSELREEQQSMEQAMNLLVAKESSTAKSEQRDIDLSGKQILYVGGRPRMVQYLRYLVEAHNGRFIHHDGGKEESRAELKNTLLNADLVFCPVDCISHDACLKVKKHCKQQSKRFIPLRSSGLSSFANGLRSAINQELQH